MPKRFGRKFPARRKEYEMEVDYLKRAEMMAAGLYPDGSKRPTPPPPPKSLIGKAEAAISQAIVEKLE